MEIENDRSSFSETSENRDFVVNVSTFEEYTGRPISCTSTLDHIDLDKVTQDILTWETTLVKLEQENNDLIGKNRSLKAQVRVQQSNSEASCHNIASLQESVKVLQTILEDRINQADDIRLLREQLISYQDREDKLKSELDDEKKSFEEKIKKQGDKHREELAHLRKEKERTYQQKEANMHKINNELHLTIKEETRKKEENKKKHEDVILKMQMEYQTKIAFIQAQNSRLQSHTNNSNSISNEIFRKKLQHVQDESAQAISRLQQEISFLRQQASRNDARNDSSPFVACQSSSVVSRTGILKRKRV